MACANYVRYTQDCKRGTLCVGDIVDCAAIPLFDVRFVSLCSLLLYSNPPARHFY